MKLVDMVVSKCVNAHIIDSEDIDWFRYGLEKRVMLILVGIPFLVLAIVLTCLWGTIGFLVSFFVLRSRINGYHANTPLQCLVASVALEYVFLGLLYPHIGSNIVALVMIASVLLIYLLAPYNHPNMQLTERETEACRKGAKIRSICLLVVVAIAMLLGMTQLAKGISLGSAMAAALLCCAYIFNWRKNNGENKDKGKQNAEWISEAYD